MAFTCSISGSTSYLDEEKISAIVLGRLMANMGYAIHGRVIVSGFARVRFSEQLALIRSDLQSTKSDLQTTSSDLQPARSDLPAAGSDLHPTFWHSDAVLVGRSDGGYLLLHTLAEMDPFPGKILLFSPVLGAAVAKNGFYVSRPPRAEKLLKLAENNAFPAPHYMEIHTGEDDNGCDPLLATRFASLVGNTKLHIVPGAGHQLTEKYLQAILSKFLGATSRYVV